MGARFSSNNETDDSDNEENMDRTIHNPNVSQKNKHKTSVKNKNKNKNKKNVRFTDYEFEESNDSCYIGDTYDNDNMNGDILPETKKRKKRSSNSSTKKRRY